MGMWDKFADRQFAKDEGGRLVFLPRGPHRPAYFVDSSDETKLKSLVKVYGVAAAIINLTGSTASLAFTQALTFDERSAPLAYKLKFGLVVYAISSALLYIGPALLLWNVYRGVLGGLCSSLTTVDPASLQLTRLPSTSHPAVVILLLTALLLFTLGIFIAISYRP
jgi:hypothetical protein